MIQTLFRRKESMLISMESGDSASDATGTARQDPDPHEKVWLRFHLTSKKAVLDLELVIVD